MAGATIGTAYVQILPSAEGIKGNLTKALGGEASSAGKSLGGKIGSGIVTGIKTTGIAVGAAVAAAGAAAVSLGKQAMSSYSQYEQLIGGVETLFGSSAEAVTKNASNAFKTAGLSANEYMETVTSFSASLLQALGGDTEKAASYADMAITDMSDNANKMGTDMGAIQAAYQGFAKQNYTMLDNLKLGYGGTKTEMERLIKDAEKMDSSFKASRDKNKELTMSYSDIVDAIHIVQTNMGITGTTAQEASTTIQGSVDSMKSAWANLVTGLADDNADLGALVDNFVQTAITAANNILPHISTILEGLGTLISTMLPQILPIINQIIIDNLPIIIEAGMQLLIALITGIITAIPQLVAAIPEIFAAMKNAFVANWPAMKEAGMQLLTMLVEGIGTALSTAVTFIQEHLAQWVSIAKAKAIEFGQNIHDGFTALVGEVGGWINDNIVTPMKDAISSVVQIGRMVVDKIKQGIQSAWSGLTSWFKGIWNSLFGNLTVHTKVSANVNGNAQGFATGLDYVPYDEFPAILHKGEAVLTASEAEDWRNGRGGSVININQTISSVPQTPVQLAAATAAAFEQARWAI